MNVGSRVHMQRTNLQHTGFFLLQMCGQQPSGAPNENKEQSCVCEFLYVRVA